MVDLSASVFRDFVTDGVPSSGANKPLKSKIRQWGAYLEALHLGAGLAYNFSSITTDADPGVGTFRLNNSTVASSTAAYLDNSDTSGALVSGIIDTWDDSTNFVRGSLTIRGITVPSVMHVFNITGAVVDGTGYRKLTVAYVSGTGVLVNGDEYSFVFNRSGDAADVKSVKDYGAIGDGVTDDYAAFQAAIDALPAVGGRILVGPKAYVLGTQPAEGAKSVHWDIAPGATFSGAGTGASKFATMVTNGNQLAVGPYIRSQSPVDFAIGGTAAFNVEALPPSTLAGYSVGIYAGAQSANAGAGNGVWAANFLAASLPGSAGIFHGLEIDANAYSAGSLMKALSINGVGTVDATVGLELLRSDTTHWTDGIDINNAVRGLRIRNTTGLAYGMTIGEPSLGGGMAAGIKQLANGGDTVLLQRVTDSGFTGNFIRAVNQANSVNLFQVDIGGNILAAGSAIVGGIVSAPGIKFPATQVLSADANTLDDYEEGTFTPVIQGGTTAGAGTYSTQIGRYTKVGDTVHAWAHVTWSAHTGTGIIRLAGLPFTVASTTNVAATLSYQNLTYTSHPQGLTTAGATFIEMYMAATNAGFAAIPIEAAAEIYAQTTYPV